MNTPNRDNPFNRIDAELSTDAYRQLKQGKIIVKQSYNELQNILEENPLYNLMFNEWVHFSSLYQHIGFKLEHHDEGNFFYLRELHEQGVDEADVNSFKVQVILLLIGRYFSRTGQNLDLLFMPDSGLEEADIEELKKDNEYSDILKTARFDKGWDEALEFLTKRNFAFRTSPSSYFISDAGKAYLLRLISNYEAG